MGFYLRKSISVGPFRFNLSKNGVGVSAGIRGLRVGSGPRGNYVHMGAGGLYYRSTLPSGAGRRIATTPAFWPKPTSGDPPIPANTHAPLVDIESSDISQIVDSSSRELLDEMNAKQKRTRLRPVAIWVVGTLLVLGLIGGWPATAMWVLSILAAVAIGAAHLRDEVAKSVVLFYDFDPQMESAYTRLHAAAEAMSQSGAAWHIEAEGAVHDRKYHAGASSIVRRKTTRIARVPPPYVKTNIETVAIAVGRQTLHFFPDRVLVYDSAGVGAVSYGELRLSVDQTRFIEDGSPPHDATVVGHTWRYVNKSGGPDRRFSNNAQLPICQYDELKFASQSGLNEVIQVSRLGIGSPFAEAVASLARVLPTERSPVAYGG